MPSRVEFDRDNLIIPADISGLLGGIVGSSSLYIFSDRMKCKPRDREL
jgi:hypothetical protein